MPNRNVTVHIPKTLRATRIPQAARDVARKKVQTARARLDRKRAKKLTRAQQRRRVTNEIQLKNARTTVSRIAQAIPRPEPKDTLARWYKESRASRASKFVNGRLPGVIKPRSVVNSMPTRFIAETKASRSRKEVVEAVRKAFAVPASQDLAKNGIEVTPLFGRHPNGSKYGLDRYFVIALRATRRQTKGQRTSIARALQKLGAFKTVWPERVQSRQALFSSTGSSELYPRDTEWHLKTMNIFDAWNLPPTNGGAQKGRGIVVAHPDTGWREHPEYDRSRLDLDRAFNVFEQTDGPDAARHDTQPQDFPLFPTHGTATGSMIVSLPADPAANRTTAPPGRNKYDFADQPLQITGVAPEARVLPIRCVDTVMLVGDVEVAQAISYAVDQDVDVISMSLGGSPSPALEAMIRFAVRERNIVVVAAAGQYVPDLPFVNGNVVAPAAYPDCIAVAGTTDDDVPWDESCRGPEVDICAPAKGVWFADFDPDGTQTIASAKGTSFATAELAGVAALWLAHHGKDELLARYPDKPLAHVFRHTIRETANAPRIGRRRWDTANWGAGIVDAHAALAFPLPAAGDVPEPPTEKFNPFRELGPYLPDLNQEVLLRTLGELVGLGKDVAKWTEDRIDEASVLVGELADLLVDSSEAAADFVGMMAGVAARETERVARETADEVARQWEEALSIAESVQGIAKAKAQEIAGDLAQMWEKAEEAVEEAQEEAEETVEDLVDAATDFVEDVAESSAETAETIVDAVMGWLS